MKILLLHLCLFRIRQILDVHLWKKYLRIYVGVYPIQGEANQKILRSLFPNLLAILALGLC